MEFTTFVRKPFTVEVVEVTDENIAEIAELVGTLRCKEDGSRYIHVDRPSWSSRSRGIPGRY